MVDRSVHASTDICRPEQVQDNGMPRKLTSTQRESYLQKVSYSCCMEMQTLIIQPKVFKIPGIDMRLNGSQIPRPTLCKPKVKLPG